MSLAVPPTGRFRPVLVIATGITVLAISAGGWLVLRSGPLRTPDHIAGLERRTDGVYAEAEQRLAAVAEAEPRIGETVTAVYGKPGAVVPTIGVAAGVIKVGHGDEIVGSLLNGLRAAGATLEGASDYPVGSSGGFRCGRIGADVPDAGWLTGTYCLWADERTVGAVVVHGRDPAAARQLAFQARTAVAP